MREQKKMKSESIIESIKLLNIMKPNIERFLELNSIGYDDKAIFTSEEYFQMYILDRVADDLEKVHHFLTQNINKHSLAEGYVNKNSKGQYQLDGYFLFPGQEIEYWYEDDYDPNLSHYLISEIDMENGEYYIKTLGKKVKIESIKIRIK
jgi:hypothetical protein